MKNWKSIQCTDSVIDVLNLRVLCAIKLLWVVRKENNQTNCSHVNACSSHVKVQFQRTFNVINRVLRSTVTYILTHLLTHFMEQSPC
jgi:hypothetical protein